MQKACGLIEKAAGEGAKVIVFPETWFPGYPVWIDSAPDAALWAHPPAKRLYGILTENSMAIPGKHLESFLKIAGKTGVYLVLGVHERSSGTLYNTMVFVDRTGKEYRIHRKLIPTYTERMVWGRGDGSTLTVLETEFGNLGGLVCWEHWMPLARAAMHAKKETLHVAQWPSVKGLHQLASQHYAFEGQCFVLASGGILSKKDVIEGYESLGRTDPEVLDFLRAIRGEDEDLLQSGGSVVIFPDGTFAESPLFDQAGIVYADIDPKKVTEGRMYLDTDGHYSRPDIFTLRVNTEAQLNVEFESHGE
jgi:predicted amidohydrolase